MKGAEPKVGVASYSESLRDAAILTAVTPHVPHLAFDQTDLER